MKINNGIPCGPFEEMTVLLRKRQGKPTEHIMIEKPDNPAWKNFEY